MTCFTQWGSREIGSMFHWEDGFPGPAWSWPEPAVYYSLCRQALFAICCAQPSRPNLWMPSFFCFEVARHCKSAAEIREYRDDCRWPEPDWTTLKPSPKDLVLAVNYFGVRSPEPWNQWRQRNACILVEDHTQDPFSQWSRSSFSDYAVCSIRKTVPVPDGAILWSPTGKVLPESPKGTDWEGSYLKAGAMLYKRWYLSGIGEADIKARFRTLQLEGEAMLGRSERSAISPVAEAIVSRGAPKLWRERRISNTAVLLKHLEHLKGAIPVFKHWPEGHAPFDLPLVFKDREHRDHCQDVLRTRNIYCPVEWICDTSDRAATELSSRILSIPTDHRYSDGEMRKVAEAILSVDCDSIVGCG